MNYGKDGDEAARYSSLRFGPDLNSPSTFPVASQKFGSSQKETPRIKSAKFEQRKPREKTAAESYVVTKMYNQDEMGQFVSTDVRLKQIMLKLNEQERVNTEMKMAMMQSKKEVAL